MSILQDKNASKTLDTKIICQLLIKSDDTINSYTAFNNALQNFLAVTKWTLFLNQISCESVDPVNCWEPKDDSR